MRRQNSVFGFCGVLQSCRSRRETIIFIFPIFRNMNSDLNSGFQYENSIFDTTQPHLIFI